MLPQCDNGDTGAVKPSKSMVLAVAIDYIKELERQRDAAVEEVERLGGKMRFGRTATKKRGDGDALAAVLVLSCCEERGRSKVGFCVSRLPGT